MCCFRLPSDSLNRKFFYRLKKKTGSDMPPVFLHSVLSEITRFHKGDLRRLYPFFQRRIHLGRLQRCHAGFQ